jgi:hypothetical protein
MSANEVIEQLESLPANEQEKVFTFLATKIIGRQNEKSKRWLGKKLSFEEACDVVFRENRELLAMLAK